MNYLEKLKQIYQEYGFIVFAWPKGSPHPRVGEVLAGGAKTDHGRVCLPQPFRQVAVATLEEYQRQSMLLGEPRIPESDLAKGDYYRAVTD